MRFPQGPAPKPCSRSFCAGACAVTGIAVPELLRASHARPWASCQNDADRLNVFNGFLLCAHLDALFDRGLMSFDADGRALWSPRISEDLRRSLGLAGATTLRWITPQHQPFLAWHREKATGDTHFSPDTACS